MLHINFRYRKLNLLHVGRLMNYSRSCSSKESKKPENKKTIGSTFWHNAFEKYLLVTNTVAAGVLAGTGDLIQQEIEYRKGLLLRRYEWKRFGSMTAVGFCLGPWTHYFYHWMDRVLSRSKKLKIVIQKILLDQFVNSPVCISFFILSLNLLEGRPLMECISRWRAKFLEVYAVDWCIGSTSQFLNFYFLPFKYQVIYVNVVALLYNIYLSFTMHKTEDWQVVKMVK